MTKIGARRANFLLALIALLALVLVSACASSSEETGATAVAEPPSAPAELPQPSPRPLSGDGSLADLISELPPAPIGFEALSSTNTTSIPVTMSVPSINVSEAVVRPVGVEPDGRMEVPPAEIVGWYEFGSVPGENGKTVLAAHVAYDGVNGVFVDLGNVDVGDEVTVTNSAGTTERYRVVSNQQYDKDALPDELFARSGPPGLVLITCGGIFDSSARSYADNIVVVAEPIA